MTIDKSEIKKNQMVIHIKYFSLKERFTIDAVYLSVYRSKTHRFNY